MSVTSLDLRAGAGGQALGLEQAGIGHAGLVELDSLACATLRCNRPEWNVIQQDLNRFDGSAFRGVDVISGGLPCPPCSVAGKHLGAALREEFAGGFAWPEPLRASVSNVGAALYDLMAARGWRGARLQSFPDEWRFLGKKTASYRQVGNAFPPPFARAAAERLSAALGASRRDV